MSERDGIGFRHYIVTENDELIKIPSARFNRLYSRDDAERFSGYRGSIVRFVEVTLVLDGSEYPFVERVSCFNLLIDSDGMVDKRFNGEALRTVLEGLPAPSGNDGTGVVINASSKFAAKKYNDRFKWEPSHALMRKILVAASH